MILIFLSSYFYFHKIRNKYLYRNKKQAIWSKLQVALCSWTLNLEKKYFFDTQI